MVWNARNTATEMDTNKNVKIFSELMVCKQLIDGRNFAGSATNVGSG